MSEIRAVKKPVIQIENQNFEFQEKGGLEQCQCNKHVVDIRDVNDDGVTDAVFLEGCLLKIEDGEDTRIYHVKEGPQNSPRNFSIVFGEKLTPILPPAEEKKKSSSSTPFEKKVERFGTHFRRYAGSHIRQLQKFSWARGLFCSNNFKGVLLTHLSSEEKSRLGVRDSDKNCVTTDCFPGSAVFTGYKGLWYPNVKRLLDTENINCLGPDLLEEENALLEKITSVIMEGAVKIFGPNDDPKEIGWAVYNVLDDHSKSRIIERLEQINGKKFCVALECLYVR